MERHFSIPLGLLLGLLLLTGSALAEGEGGYEPDPAQMDAWQKAMTPAENHKHFEYFVGDWDAEITMYMGPEPMTSTGTAHYEWILGGRYLHGTTAGDFMGMPMHGFSIDGYDNVTGRYFSVWLDNMGTGYMLSHGEKSEDGKSVTYTGSMPDPMTGAEVNHRMVTMITGDNTYVFEMFMTAVGAPEEVLAMVIKYTRKQ